MERDYGFAYRSGIGALSDINKDMTVALSAYWKGTSEMDFGLKEMPGSIGTIDRTAIASSRFNGFLLQAEVLVAF